MAAAQPGRRSWEVCLVSEVNDGGGERKTVTQLRMTIKKNKK